MKIEYILLYSILLVIIFYKTYENNNNSLYSLIVVFISTILFYKYIRINYAKYNQKTKLELNNKKKANELKYRYLYTSWIFIWLILIKLNIVTISCYPSAVVASVFCIIYTYLILNNINNISITFLFIGVLLHYILIIFSPYNLSYKTIILNFLVFFLYLFFLAIHNKTYEEVYYKDNINYLRYTKLSTKYLKNMLNI